MEKIYVVGHISPDTDTVVSAIILADFLNKREKTSTYTPVITGKLNSETEFILHKFQVNTPEILENAEGKKLFLVDHNESSQQVKGADNILGFVDHHKVDFKSSLPIEIVVKPWGCTATIIYDLYKKENIPFPDELLGITLGAALSDTVIMRSPTTTDKDREIIREIASKVDIDVEKLGLEQFRAKSEVATKSAEEIIYSDYKEFNLHGKLSGIGQIEAPSYDDIDPRIEELVAKMKEIKEEKNYHAMVLMLTDIIQEGTKFIIISDAANKIVEQYGTTIKDNVTEFCPGVLSRKKQVTHVIEKASEE